MSFFLARLTLTFGITPFTFILTIFFANLCWLIFGPAVSAYVLASAGNEMSDVSLWAWLHKLDKNHLDNGLVSGAIVLFQDLGWAVGPLLAGLLFSRVRTTYTLITGATFILLV